MTITKTRVTCRDCKHVGDVDLVTDAPISVACASMEATRCGKCSSGNLGLGGEISTGKPSVLSPIESRSLWWIKNGDRGVSSETIYGVFAETRPRDQCFPWDPDDFSRCRALLDLIPEWRHRISELSSAIPWFSPFVENWDEMDRLWDEESPSDNCPKLYALMQRCSKQAVALQKAKK